jgi:hypothetical protein
MMPIEEQDPCPEVDRVLKSPIEIVLQPLTEETFDTTIRVRRSIRRLLGVAWGVSHLAWRGV